MGSLDGLDRRLSKLEERQSGARVTWRTESGRQVSFDSLEMFRARMDLNRLLCASWLGEEPPVLGDALEALFNTSPEERARLAKSVPWLSSWDYEMERLHSEEDALEFRQMVAEQGGSL